MPRRVALLTDLKVRSAKKREKAYKLADGGGLFLEVTPAGAKLWRLKYGSVALAKNTTTCSTVLDI